MEEELYEFLKEMDKEYPIPLSQRVNLLDYAKKLAMKAHILVKREDGKIVALVAGYLENSNDDMSYISIVGVLPYARRRGYAKELFIQYIDDCKKEGRGGVHLYVYKDNVSALNLYYSLGFKEYQMENELRANDIHLAYWLK